MSNTLQELDELVQHLVRGSRLTPSEVGHLIEEVIAFLDCTPSDFVRRRQLNLRSEGLTNSEIFAQLQSELRQRRFKAPEYSERQLRRIIYG
jgi:hypothetical protein